MEHKTKNAPVAHFKALDETEGIAEMIVSVYGNVDFAKERCIYGCFAKSLQKKLPKGVWMHDWSQPVAKTLEAIELKPGDPRLPDSIKKQGGLYIKGQFNLGTQRGKDAFSDLCFGTVDEFSFGYDVIDAAYDTKGVLDLKELDIYEWSPVLLGCNPATAILSAKGFSAGEIKDLKDALRREFAQDRGKGQSAPAAAALVGPEEARDFDGVKSRIKAQYLGENAEQSVTFGAIYDLFYSLVYGPVWNAVYGGLDEDETPDDRVSELGAAFDEFRDISLQIFTALMGMGEKALSDDAETVKALLPPASENLPLPAGARYEKQLETALAAVEICVRRGEAIKAIRAKDRRTLSEGRRNQLQDMQKALGDLLTASADAGLAPADGAGQTDLGDTGDAAKATLTLALDAAAAKHLLRKSRLRAQGVLGAAGDHGIESTKV